VSERAGLSFQNVFRELGLATRDDMTELELRVAQLEHRLRLVEGEPARPIPSH
jgi:BMFP domain-containing protein YqiC